jgi:UDP-N-acetylglucosamine 2-epimerase (non-hydrolysing)
MRITIIAGARPNFIKIAPIIKAIEKAIKDIQNISFRLVHTGQHYDHKMSGSFFEQLGIPAPDINLECGGGSQAEQTASIMINFEKELINNPTDLVLVVGDVTSTMACAVTAKKLCVKVAHVEAGIRSKDRNMPEEINRLVTDSISDYFFTTTENASAQLVKEGIAKQNIFFVGNTMIDTLLSQLKNFQKPAFWTEIQLEKNKYWLLTLHRPSNVDNETHLAELIQAIIDNSNDLPIIFPVHPRTKVLLEKLNLNSKNIHLIDPLSYLEFNYLVQNSLAVITDSGGITEETTIMGVPCMTLRDSTERPETVTIGTNELLGTNPDALKPYMQKAITGDWKKGSIPDLWDGNTSERIISTLIDMQF